MSERRVMSSVKSLTRCHDDWRTDDELCCSCGVYVCVCVSVCGAAFVLNDDDDGGVIMFAALFIFKRRRPAGRPTDRPCDGGGVEDDEEFRLLLHLFFATHSPQRKK